MWQKFWTLFGASNQLLAALTLLVDHGLAAPGAGSGSRFTLLPMLFVLAITLWALGKLTITNLGAAQGFDVELLNGVAAALLIVLALYLAVSALLRLRAERKGEAVPAGV